MVKWRRLISVFLCVFSFSTTCFSVSIRFYVVDTVRCFCDHRKLDRRRVLSRGDISCVVCRRRSCDDGACSLRSHVARPVCGTRHGSPWLSVGCPRPRWSALLRPSQLSHPCAWRRAGEPTTLSSWTQDLPVCQLPMCTRCVENHLTTDGRVLAVCKTKDL